MHMHRTYVPEEIILVMLCMAVRVVERVSSQRRLASSAQNQARQAVMIIIIVLYCAVLCLQQWNVLPCADARAFVLRCSVLYWLFGWSKPVIVESICRHCRSLSNGAGGKGCVLWVSWGFVRWAVFLNQSNHNHAHLHHSMWWVEAQHLCWRHSTNW